MQGNILISFIITYQRVLYFDCFCEIIQREQIRQSFDKDLTFSPELVSKSRARDSPDENLFERLTNYIKGDPTKIDKIRHDREAELTFQPALTRKSHEIGARTKYELLQ